MQYGTTERTLTSPLHLSQPAQGGPALKALLLQADAAATIPAALIDALEIGLIMASADGQLLRANQTAKHWLAGNAPLTVSAGQLCGRLGNGQDRLLQALALARQGRRSMLRLDHAGRPCEIGVVPQPGSLQQPPWVLFVLGTLGRPTDLALQFFCQAYRLTSAESSVLAGLCKGLSPSQVAADGRVHICTVRSQISAIRSKTGARSLPHLLRIVNSLPPLAQAVGHAG